MHLRDIDEIKEILRDETSLEDAIRWYDLEPGPVGRDSVKIVCPFHEDTDPSLVISTKKQVYYCHGCGASGDIFTFVGNIENVEFVESIHIIAERVGFDLTPYKEKPTEADRQRQKLIEKNRELLAAGTALTEDWQFQEWIANRRLDERILAQYEIGYSRKPPIRFKSPIEREKWTNSIVVPLLSSSGQPLGFRNRLLGGRSPKTIAHPEGYPIHLPPVYGFYTARSLSGTMKMKEVILVEGEVDVWQMAAAGYTNTCAVMGTNLDNEKLEYLWNRGVRSVILLPDGDKGGRLFAARVARSKYNVPIAIKIGQLQGGDPDEVLLRNKGEVDDALAAARHRIHYLIDEILDTADATTITGKIDTLTEIKQVVWDLYPAERSLAIDELASRLNMDRTSVSDFFLEESEDEVKLHNTHGEKIVLSRMIGDEDFAGDAILRLNPDVFYMERHRQIYTAMRHLFTSRHPIEIETVETTLTNNELPGAAKYMRSMVRSSMNLDGATLLLDDIIDKSIRREARNSLKNASSRLSHATEDTRGTIATLMGELSSAIVSDSHEITSIHTVVDDIMATMEDRIQDPNMIIGLDLGRNWRTLNHTIHGLQRGRYTVIAAPSNVGKTGIACDWTNRFAVHLDEPVLFLTFETTRETLTNRIIAAHAGVEMEKMTTGYINDEDLEAVLNAAEDVAAAPIVISERGNAVEDAVAIIRHDFLKRNTRVAFVDYIQLMRLSDRPRGLSRYQELGDVSRMLLKTAQELNITIVALCQINREGSKSQTPGITDVGDSYMIAQDSDIFIIVWDKTQDEIDADGLDRGNKMGLVAKNRRDGPNGVMWRIDADLAIQRFREVV